MEGVINVGMRDDVDSMVMFTSVKESVTSIVRFAEVMHTISS